MSTLSRFGGLSIYDFAWVFSSQGLEGPRRSYQSASTVSPSSEPTTSLLTVRLSLEEFDGVRVAVGQKYSSRRTVTCADRRLETHAKGVVGGGQQVLSDGPAARRAKRRVPAA